MSAISREILKNDFVTITKDDDSRYIFSFIDNELFKIQESVLDSIIKTKYTKSRDGTNVKYIIEANLVETYDSFLRKKQQFLGYNDCLQMIQSMGEQFQLLDVTKQHCFMNINTKNIAIINEEIYVYLSDEALMKYDESTNMVLVDIRLEKSSPELYKLDSIPNDIHKNNWMYIFGSIILAGMTNQTSYMSELIKDEPEKHIEKIKKLLSPITQLPVYYMLLRFLRYDPTERTYLYI